MLELRPDMAPASTSAEATKSKAETAPKSDTASTAPACNQCRSRKIRCNRQLPNCSNCRKAGVQCDFSSRGKRINHTKQL